MEGCGAGPLTAGHGPSAASASVPAHWARQGGLSARNAFVAKRALKWTSSRVTFWLRSANAHCADSTTERRLLWSGDPYGFTIDSWVSNAGFRQSSPAS